MTVVLALKVADAAVLGADSATTMIQGNQILNVYFNAEKVFNLRKDLKIGMVTYGLGALQSRSISSHAKDLRIKLATDGDPFYLDSSKFTMKDVAERVQRYFVSDLYKRDFPVQQPDGSGGVIDVYAGMGFLVAGYGAGQSESEVWRVGVEPDGVGYCNCALGPGEYGILSEGQPEAIERLSQGWSRTILEGFVASGVPETEALDFLQSHGAVQLLQPGMPVQDAIDLAKYLCEVTAGFVRFLPGGPTVHPPIDIAAITCHEGFRWVQRKHYYNSDLNPTGARG